MYANVDVVQTRAAGKQCTRSPKAFHAVPGLPLPEAPPLVNWGTTLFTAHLRGRPPFRGPRVPFRNPPSYHGSRALKPPLAFFGAGAGSGHCSFDALRRVTSS